jgi:hypothetical protein
MKISSENIHPNTIEILIPIEQKYTIEETTPRGHPPNELQLQTQYFSSCLITLLEPLYIVLPSPKNILEEESSRSRTF